MCIITFSHKPHPCVKVELNGKSNFVPTIDIPVNHVCAHKSATLHDAKIIWTSQASEHVRIPL